MEPIVETRNLYVNLSGATVLEDITLAINKGDFVALMGPNGAGKTTLIRAILGFIPHFSGRITLFGKDVGHFKEHHRIGYIPQRVYFDKSFPINVFEIVSLGLVAKLGLLRRPDGNDRLKVKEAIDKTGLNGLEGRRASELSGGQQQRVLIARALVGHPDLLILDEPTASTDVAFRERFWEMLGKLNTEDGMTVIIVTHQSDIKPPLNAKIALLNKKLIHYCGWDVCKNSAECSVIAGIHA
ncbi:MAG: metal ABC transporter ATP-binding protein [archaeon]